MNKQTTEIQKRENNNSNAAIRFEGPTSDGTTKNNQLGVQQSRAMSEVQGAIVMARNFPRDCNAGYSRIMQACQRRRLAETALYSYPRGSTQVTGPSIRLAEELARDWGNIDFGITELSQDTHTGMSQVMAYCWDLETNVRQTKVFQVPHTRFTKNGSHRLTDPRDIYEMVANQGARRLRACILGVIPGDVVEDAVNACEKTLRDGSSEPLVDRIRKMAASFAEMGVTIDMLEKRLCHKLEASNETEIIALGKIYISLRDNMAGVDDFFERGRDEAKSGTESLAEKLTGKKDTKSQEREEKKSDTHNEPEEL